MKYRTKPLIVLAFRATKENYDAPITWPEWVQEHRHRQRFVQQSIWKDHMNNKYYVETASGPQILLPGMWVVQDPVYGIRVLSHEVFEETYEPVA